MGYLIDILIGAASRIVVGELGAHVEPTARWIIDKAVERLPVDERARFREEWTAHLNETPGSFRKLLHALGCCLAASALANMPQITDGTRHQRAFFEILGADHSDRVMELARLRLPWVMELARLLPWDDLSPKEQIRQTARVFVDLLEAKTASLEATDVGHTEIPRDQIEQITSVFLRTTEWRIASGCGPWPVSRNPEGANGTMRIQGADGTQK
jgi:hypothetical protein